MENCLKTQLKEVVQNDNLKYLGKGEFEVISGTNSEVQLNFVHKGEVKLTLISGDISKISSQNYTTISGNTITIDGRDGEVHNSTDANAYGLRFSDSGTYKFRYDKYNFMPFVVQTHSVTLFVNVDDIKYIIDEIGIPYGSTGFEFFFGIPMNGNFGDLLSKWKGTNFVIIDRYFNSTEYNSNMTGNITQLNDKVDLTGITLRVLANISGSLESLMLHPNRDNITTLNFDNCIALTGDLNTVLPAFKNLTYFNGENNTRFSGTLTTIAENCIAARRQAGTSLQIKGNMPNVTPNPTIAGNTINFISDGQGGVTYEIV